MVGLDRFFEKMRGRERRGAGVEKGDEIETQRLKEGRAEITEGGKAKARGTGGEGSRWAKVNQGRSIERGFREGEGE